MNAERVSRGARALSARIPCDGCGAVFTPRRLNQRHCRPACRARASRVRKAQAMVATIAQLTQLVGVAR